MMKCKTIRLFNKKNDLKFQYIGVKINLNINLLEKSGDE